MGKKSTKSIELSVVSKGGLPSFEQLRESDISTRVDTIKRCAEIVAQGEYYRGRALRDLRSDTAHGDWGVVLTALGWTAQRARNYINFADFADRVYAIDPTVLPELDMTHWMLFQKCDEKELKALLGGDEIRGVTLEDAKTKTKKELQLAISDWQRSANAALVVAEEKLIGLSEENNKFKAENAELRARLESKPLSPHFAQWVLEDREAAIAQHKKCKDAAAMLARMLDKAIASQKPRGKKGHEDWRAATGTTLQLLAGLAAEIQMCVKGALEHLPEEFLTYQPDFILTDEEAETIRNLAAGILPEATPNTGPKTKKKRK